MSSVAAPTTKGFSLGKLWPAQLNSRGWRDFRRNPLAQFGFWAIIALILLALLAPLLARYNPETIDYFKGLQPPSLDNWFGTDNLGRDTYSRLLYAARISLTVGLGVSFLSVIIGTLVGALAGYFGGLIDQVLSRVMDLILSFPQLPLIMVIGAFVRITPVLLVVLLGSLGWVGVARLVRAQALSLRERDFVLAARAIGQNNFQIILRHIVPNTTAPIVVAATLAVANAILAESALSFLGFGVDPSTPTWGNMLQNAQNYLLQAPWLSVFPGIMISLTVTSFNFVGDGVREAFDPRLKGR